MNSSTETKCCVLVVIICLLFCSYAKAQEYDVSQVPYFSYGKGLGIISPDSLYLLNIRFRMQNRVAFSTVAHNDFNVQEIEARVRRLRLRFDGFIYRKDLTYVIQLSFTRADQDFDVSGVPNVVRDAMVFYSVNDHLMLGVGQTKLPGNRQRVNSSGDLQLVDRSIVNSTFNIDRDFGIQVYYFNYVGSTQFVLRGAITSGEGRNSNVSDNGLAYTGRLELLPMGPFTLGGDYFEGDLAREPTPKLSVALTYSMNNGATRTGGQIGFPLYESRDILTEMTDVLFKYKGFAFASEFLCRDTNNPITTSELGAIRYVYAGFGQNYQSSYLFKNDIEIVGRYTRVSPSKKISAYENETQQFTLGLNRYLKGHRVKLQTDLTYQNILGNFNRNATSNWISRFQIEIGI